MCLAAMTLVKCWCKFEWSQCSVSMVVPTGESARALSGSGHMYELINAIPRIAFSISTAVHRVKTQFGEKFSEEVFEIDWRNFYTNLLELFCQCISWTNWVNSGKFMDNCWISCQVMADMKKFKMI